MLKVIIKDINKWNDIIYQQKDDGDLDIPTDNGIWTIWHPSIKIKKFYPNCVVRKYGKDQFLLSSEASKIIPSNEDAGGSAAILTFFVNEKRYFLCTIDSSKYIKNAQGGANYGESRIECLKREIYEELKINLRDEQCTQIGHWIYTSYNKIVYTKFKNRTDLFLVELEIEQISHLLNNRIIQETEDMIIISAKEYDFKLDETQYVVITSIDAIDTFPEKFEYQVNNKKIKLEWNGHHREALLCLLGKSRFKISYLLNFDVNYRI